MNAYAPDCSLAGKVAFVTGASSGLGRHIALGLAESGSDVVLVSRSGAALAEVADEIAGMGRQSLPLASDITELETTRDVVGQAVARFGKIDVLVNCAGTNIPQVGVDVSEEAWDHIFDLNVRATFFLTQTVGKEMIAAGGGRIISIASQMAEVGFFERAAYCASKGALVQFSRALAVEWAKLGVRVNCIGPTFIDSPLAAKVLSQSGMETEILERIPIGRMGQMKEVTGAVIYLASEAGDLVTGHHLLVDGGWTAW